MNEMTKLYSPSCWVPGKSRNDVMTDFFEKIQVSYENLKNNEKLVKIEDLPYGIEENQKIDIWGEVKDKLLIFIHGGYWSEGSRKTCLTPANCSFDAGFPFASIGYGLAINGRSLTDTVEDTVFAVEFLIQKFPKLETIVIGGHSAGAHLAVHVASRIQSSKIRGLILFAGCYFLKDLVETEIGQDISLTPEVAKLNSCNLQLLENRNFKILIVLGLQEAPKLIEQNRQFAEKVGGAKITEFPKSGHYTIMTNLMNAGSGEFQEMINFLKDI